LVVNNIYTVKKWILCICSGILLGCTSTYGQSVDSLTNKLVNFPSRIFGHIQSKTASLDAQLTKQTEKYLEKMAKREERLKKRLYKKDSAAAKQLFANSAAQYAALENKLRSDTGVSKSAPSGPYMAYTDSLKTTLAFLQQHPQLAGSSVAEQQQLQASMNQLGQLQTKIQDADVVKQFLQQRKAQISNYLQQYTQLPSGITNSFNAYKQDAYYYSQQVQAYKDELNDPDKLFTQALQLLDKLPAFTSFVQKNSMLASLFNIPATPGAPGSGSSLGMPSRDQLMASITGAGTGNGAVGTGAGMSDAAGGAGSMPNLQQSVNAAQGQVDQLRDKLNAAGGNSSGDLDVPDFKPNAQKTKSFLHRLEFGTNLQSTHSTFYFPTTTDIGVSLGYKLTSKNVVGVGASYKVGWGSDIQHVNLSGQGVGLRSFIDINIKKTFYASGGFEYNYQQPFAIQGLPGNLESWQKSGLIGVSKIVSMKSRPFKNTKLQLLWDFLSYQEIPRGQPLKFRVGYSF